MAEEDPNSWVFDSLVCFLNGPIWNAPLQNFIEEKSLIFEPNNIENDDYKKIYEEFKNLVDFMLGNFIDDLGITSEQFHNACTEGKKYHVTFDQGLFELIWAANDYDMFKTMMTQRNVELQLQALELIERKYGITPELFKPKKKPDSVEQENPVVVEKINDSETEVMGEVAKEFPTSEEDAHFILEEKDVLKQALEEVKEMTHHKAPEDEEALQTEVQVENVKEPTPSRANTVEIDSLELKKRQEYLRAQRDKLVALKKDVRKKQLTAENQVKDKPLRPKSARAAQAVLTGEKVNAEPDQLKIRKTLAERLKSEVVNKQAS